jgi:hypothetical protein
METMKLTSSMVMDAVKAGVWDQRYKDMFGGWNDAPPNWRECSADEFYRYFSTWGFGIGTGFNQIKAGDKEPLLSVHLIHYHDGTGFGIHVDWKYGEEREWVPRFFKFAVCEHERVETLSTRGGWHEGHCGKCGFVMNYDSSG